MTHHVPVPTEKPASTVIVVPREADTTWRRMLGMHHVDTEFAVFVDNDTLVAPGAWEVHAGGGDAHIEGDGATRRFVEHNALLHRPPSDLDGATREPSEFVELRDTTIDDWFLRGTLARRLQDRYRTRTGLRSCSWRVIRRARRAVDRVATPAALEAGKRSRERCGPVRVTHPATWSVS